MSRQLEFWRRWHDEGRDSAITFAAHDRAAPSTAAATAPVNGPADADADAGAGAAEAAVSPAAPAEAAADAEADAAIAAAVAATAPSNDAAAAASDLLSSDAKFANFLAKLDLEKFWAWVGHADNATHFKASGNIHWWSNQQDTLGFIRSIWQEFGCPGKGKGPWDGLGAVVKTKVRTDIVNGARWIKTARDVAQHLRTVFASGAWMAKHKHMSIKEMVVFFIHKDEKDGTGFPKID